MRTWLTYLTAASMILGTAPKAFADGQEKLSSLLPGLYSTVWAKNQSPFIEFFDASPDDPKFEGQFDARMATVRSINEFVGIQLSTVPLGSSGAGFSWQFNAETGTFDRTTNSFGPSFTERALTIGRRRLGLGFNYQHSSFDKLQGQSLRGNEIRHYTGLTDTELFFEDALDLRLSTDTVSMYVNYGLTDHFDIGVMVPATRVSLKATLTTHFGTKAEGVRPDDESFIDSTTGTAQGVGDIVARAKYNFLARPGGGLAAGVDVRLPTGDAENLLGIGKSQVKVYLAGSNTVGKVSPHFNGGFTASAAPTTVLDVSQFVLHPPDELSYSGGIDVAVTPRMTVVGDLLGRTLRGVGTLQLAASGFGERFREFRSVDGADLNLLLGAAGIKFNPRSNSLVSANVLFPLRNHGLTDTLTLVLGFDYSF